MPVKNYTHSTQNERYQIAIFLKAEHGQSKISNLELSTNRVHCPHCEQIAGRMVGSKVTRVIGLTAMVLYDRQNVYSPINRRISIVIVNKKTKEAILANRKSVEIEDATDVGSATNASAGTAR